ncbi:Z1 domain-containing protein [Bosea psychrotolerans]|uniref:Z1 domain-containing protein n=1 Tax=Bosea psychrotolerans TaxID=1871628 RepID=A0A2S4LSW6_9HYPH|nr:Z1 domain-containing protein [Bosea psychrotolerans]POR45556.1 Z1 domain-containing protein [Bosea psychrotolerans]
MEYDLVGISEIATMAGVSAQAVANWRVRSSDFPQPLKELASGPVFRRTQIRAWLKRNNRKLGTLKESSSYYSRLKSFRNDDEALSTCIEEIVVELESASTSGEKPGMLLGRIQSGKTRGFVGVIAKAFDRGFDIAIVLTKGTKTLSAQTVRRLESDFAEFIADDEFLVVDIMNLPGTLRRSELRRKVVIVAKKQARNLDKLIEFIEAHEDLQKRRVLLIDDEADLASVRFVRKAGNPGVNQGTIADQIDQLRDMATGIAFLQVTATPYSLYLQPEDYDAANTNYVFKPKRPAFTKLLPIHSGYVGGDDYFGSFEGDDPRSKLIVEVAEQEQEALRRSDKRRISASNVLETDNLTGLRRAIITFVVAVGVRRWQQREGGERAKKYAMVIHNDIARAAHAWQDQVIDWIFRAIVDAAENDPAQLRPLFDAAYDDLEASVFADKGKMPPRDEAFDAFIDALQSDDVAVEKVNSDTDVMALLDANAELKLRTPYNIWVGGNILDRGITIPNLISFYYGRNPKTMQADTVLQHSRMYGNRDRRDLAVTRFYTSRAVYDRLYTINALEGSLRNAFQTGAHDAGVVFIQADASRRVRPCAPNKVLLSDVVAVSPSDMLLPSDFQTKGGSTMAKIQAELDCLIKPEWRDTESYVTVDRKTAIAIVDVIEKSMEFDTVEFEWDAMRGLIDYYADVAQGGDGKILIYAETGRKLSRAGSGDKSGRSILGTALRRKVLDEPRSKPALILLQQEGGRELGWTAHKFWWPLFAAPTDAEPCVFATKVAS